MSRFPDLSVSNGFVLKRLIRQIPFPFPFDSLLTYSLAKLAFRSQSWLLANSSSSFNEPFHDVTASTFHGSYLRPEGVPLIRWKRPSLDASGFHSDDYAL
ncbi:MAG: hypothetical protein H6999_06700 [Hahellaceae bacterium]|nr:hypothetical protein [Hahellaceae bacterium]